MLIAAKLLLIIEVTNVKYLNKIVRWFDSKGKTL